MHTIEIKEHVFKTWDDIPDVSHLLKVKNNYVRAFEHNVPNNLCYVAYALRNGTVVAFGSATYFKQDHSYMDDDDGYCSCAPNFNIQRDRRLWIEGLVSIEKGCGSL